MEDREPSRMASSDHPAAAMLCPDAYGSAPQNNPTMVPGSVGMMHGMHLTFNPMAPCMSKPTELSNSLYHGDTSLGISPGAGVSMSEPVKKRRGRPRKYGPDGSMVLALTSPTSVTSGYSSNPSSEPSLPKRRGRPPGSGKKRQLDALVSAFVETSERSEVDPILEESHQIGSFAEHTVKAIASEITMISAPTSLPNGSHEDNISSLATMETNNAFEVAPTSETLYQASPPIDHVSEVAASKIGATIVPNLPPIASCEDTMEIDNSGTMRSNIQATDLLPLKIEWPSASPIMARAADVSSAFFLGQLHTVLDITPPPPLDVLELDLQSRTVGYHAMGYPAEPWMLTLQMVWGKAVRCHHEQEVQRWTMEVLPQIHQLEAEAITAQEELTTIHTEIACADRLSEDVSKLLRAQIPPLLEAIRESCRRFLTLTISQRRLDSLEATIGDLKEREAALADRLASIEADIWRLRRNNPGTKKSS